MLTLVDEFTLEYLSIDVARYLNSNDVLESLAWLMVTRGVLDHIRSDNGLEFTAKLVRDWLKGVGVKTLFIEPGSPWEMRMDTWKSSTENWQMKYWSEKCATRWPKRRS